MDIEKISNTLAMRLTGGYSFALPLFGSFRSPHPDSLKCAL